MTRYVRYNQESRKRAPNSTYASSMEKYHKASVGAQNHMNIQKMINGFQLPEEQDAIPNGGKWYFTSEPSMTQSPGENNFTGLNYTVTNITFSGLLHNQEKDTAGINEGVRLILVQDTQTDPDLTVVPPFPIDSLDIFGFPLRDLKDRYIHLYDEVHLLRSNFLQDHPAKLLSFSIPCNIEITNSLKNPIGGPTGNALHLFAMAYGEVVLHGNFRYEYFDRIPGMKIPAQARMPDPNQVISTSGSKYFTTRAKKWSATRAQLR